MKLTSSTQSRKKSLLKSIAPLFITIGVYSLISYLVISNIPLFANLKKVSDSKEVVEGLILPSADISISDIFNADPLQSSTDSEGVLEVRKNVAALIFSSLFKENISGGLDLDIVKEYQFTGAKDLKIKIYDNIKWHDGEKLTAQDIIFTLDKIKSLRQEGIFYGALNGEDISYKQINDFEVQISLHDSGGTPKPNAAYLFELTFPILPKHLLDGYIQSQITKLSTTEFGRNPIGSGKFKFQSNLGTELLLVKNDDYFGQKVKLDAYIYRFYRDYDSLIKDYYLKNVDIFYRKDGVIGDQISTTLKDYKAREFATNLRDRNLVLYFNMNYKDLDKSPIIKFPSVRNLLYKIIDRNKILASVNNTGRIIYGPIDQVSPSFLNEIIEEQKVDVNDFKTKIEAAGWKKVGDFYEKDGLKLGFTLTYLEGDVRDRIAEVIKNTFKESGVDVKLDKLTDNDPKVNADIGSAAHRFNNVINNRDFEVLMTAVNQYLDPDRVRQWHSSRSNPPGLNLSGFESTVADVTLLSGKAEVDPEVRKNDYQKFQRNFMVETPAIYLLNTAIMTNYTPKLHGVEIKDINDIQHKYDTISQWEIDV